MAKAILTHQEIAADYGNLQRGMNYRARTDHSVVLMSQTSNAPYEDYYDQDTDTIYYEGHDVTKAEAAEPKRIDQPRHTPLGRLTQNGRFAKAVEEYKAGKRQPEKVRVFEKLRSGIWVDNGYFDLVDYHKEVAGGRRVFKFHLKGGEPPTGEVEIEDMDVDARRIPSRVKKEVFKRDEGRCVMCGKASDLHFDHVIPFSKGGSSTDPNNIQILCGRHNLEKRDKIQ